MSDGLELDPAQPRAWVLNLDAEYELEASGPYTPRKGVRRLVATHVDALARALVRPGDVLIDEAGPPDPRAAGLPGFAWCMTPRARALLERAGALPVDAPAFDVLRAVNRRAFATDVRASFLAEAGLEAFDKDLARTLEETLALVARPSPAGWLVRRPFGTAGRGRRRLHAGRPDAGELAWLRASLRLGPLIVEPFVSVSREFTRSGLVHRDGRVECAGPGLQATTRTGAWTRTEVASRGDVTRAHDEALEAVCLAAGESLAAAGFFGPFGIDAFLYRTGDREVLNPLSEINARRTMDWHQTMDRRHERDSLRTDRRTVMKGLGAALFVPGVVLQQGRFGGRGGGFRALGGREVPAVLDRALDYVVERQHEKGYWPTKDKAGAVGLTALAASSLMAYPRPAREAPRREELEKALAWLRDALDPQTGAARFDARSFEESDAPVFQHALVAEALGESIALKIGATNGKRVKARRSALAYLTSVRNEDGSWPARPGGEEPCVATTLQAASAFRRAAVYDDDDGAHATVVESAAAWVASSAAATAAAGGTAPWHAERDGVLVPARILLRGMRDEPLSDEERAGWIEALHAQLPRTEEEEVVRPWGVLYGTLAARHLGGRDGWSPWNTAMKEALLPLQRPSARYEGAWPRTWRKDKEGGALFGTLLSTLTLSAYVRELA